MNQLNILKLRFRLKAKRRYTNKGYIGNRIRGLLGRSLAYRFCSAKESNFTGCTCRPPCVYGTVFKPVKTHPEFTTLLSPFVVGIFGMDRERIEKGEKCDFTITLFGDAVRYWRHMVEAVKMAFGSRDEVFIREEEQLNDSFELLDVRSDMEEKIIYQNGDYLAEPSVAIWSDADVFHREIFNRRKTIELTVRFRSRLLFGEDVNPVPDFSRLIDAIMLRLSGMIDLYQGGEFLVPYGLLYRKPKVETRVVDDQNLTLNFRGEILRYLPYIEVGSQLHIGKRSTSGFGEYEYDVMEDKNENA